MRGTGWHGPDSEHQQLLDLADENERLRAALADAQKDGLDAVPEWVWCVARWECVPNGDYAGWRCFEGRCAGPHHTLYIDPDTKVQPSSGGDQ